MTFTLNIKTAQDKALEAAQTRATRLKAECRERVLSVADETTQANIAQAAVIYLTARADGAPAADARSAVGFVDGDLNTAAAWREWVGSMQAECRRAISAGDDPVWPKVPAGVEALAERF